jgi:hypothetical protein
MYLTFLLHAVSPAEHIEVYGGRYSEVLDAPKTAYCAPGGGTGWIRLALHSKC